MRESMKYKCDLFVENYNEIKKNFKWSYTTSLRLGALLYAMEDKHVDTQAINRCKALIKNNTGVFSQFKQTTYFIVTTMISLKEQPETLLKSAIKIYEDMKKAGFHSSPYLVFAALSVAMQKEAYEHTFVIAKAKDFYDSMKREHRFITSSDDYGFATLLAMTDRQVEQAIREMEGCFRKLKENFTSSNTIQTLSHVLAFSEEETIRKCNRVVELDRALKNRKCKFGSGMEQSFLGVIALLDENAQRLADEIAQTNEYLKNRKGFGYWSISARERLMYAAALVCNDYVDDLKKDTMGMALANNVTGILLAQQMAMIAASTSASVAASSN